VLTDRGGVGILLKILQGNDFAAPGLDAVSAPMVGGERQCLSICHVTFDFVPIRINASTAKTSPFSHKINGFTSSSASAPR